MKHFHTLPAVLLGVVALVPTPNQTAQALSATEVSAIAEAVTVRIDGQNPGSGVLIKQQGNTYTVLTAAHVVATEDEYELITTDEQRYPLAYNRVKKLPGIDLALVEFSSSRSYQLVKLGDSNTVKSGSSVYVSGFPMPTAAITEPIWNFSPGTITANAKRPLADGYALVYTNSTLPGMSGGAVLDNEGKLIGIHGRADTEQQVQRTETVYVKTGFNLGIPIHRFLALAPNVNPNLGFEVATSPSIPAPSSRPALTADDWYLSGGNKYQKKDYQGAIADYTKAIQLNSSYAQAYYNRGVSQDSLKQYQKAIADYSQAIQFKPDYTNAYYNRAINRFELGDKQGAISDFNKAIQLQPNYAEAYYNRGVAFSKLNNKQAALADYTKAIQFKPNDSGAYYNRGVVRHELGDSRGAIVDYTKAIQINPNSDSAYFNRGTVRSALGDTAGAITDYSKAIQINPRKANAYYNRGNDRYSQGDRQGALSDLSKAIQLRPNYTNAYFNRGIVRKSLGDKKGALSDFKASARLSQQEGNQAYYEDSIRQIQSLTP